MENEKSNETTTVIGLASAGGAAGAAVATAAGIALAVPVAIGAGVACLGFAAIKIFKKD